MISIFKMFEVDNEEKLIIKISTIFAQFQDFNHFLKVINLLNFNQYMTKFKQLIKKLLDLDEEMKIEAVLSYIMKLLERMKLRKNEDIETLMKIEKELKITDHEQLLNKIILLNIKKH